jgi:molybdopterin biosynthesis enzyme
VQAAKNVEYIFRHGHYGTRAGSGRKGSSLLTYTVFLRGCFNGGKVKPLRGQGSHMLSSFLKTNCLIELGPSPARALGEGEKVKVFLL